MDAQPHDGPPRAVLFVAVTVAVAAVIAVLVVAALRQRPATDQPVAIVPVSAPQADSAQCRTLVDALPEHLGDFRRAAVVDPAPAGAAAWRASPDGQPVIVRCGLERPPEFVVGSALQVVDDVQWFQLADQGRSSWFAVDRPVYIALTLPQGSGPTPIQQLSQVIAKSLPPKPIDPAPVR